MISALFAFSAVILLFSSAPSQRKKVFYSQNDKAINNRGDPGGRRESKERENEILNDG
jgi:hypothetical protein